MLKDKIDKKKNSTQLKKNQMRSNQPTKLMTHVKHVIRFNKKFYRNDFFI
jgi:hypothetical protein